MDEINPYAPPVADLEAGAVTSTQPPFFAVSPLKLVVMSLATFGYYVVYWHYRQWKAIRAAEKLKLWSFARALFFPLTGFELYPKLQKASEDEGFRLRWQGWMLAVAAILVNILNWISGAIKDELPVLNAAWVLAIVPPFIAQFAIQAVHARVVPEVDQNTRLTLWNIPWLALGLFFWLVLGLRYIPYSHPR